MLTPDGAVPLSVNQYPNTLYPDGHTRLVRFALDDGPVWTWSVGGVELERRVLLVPGEQTVVVRYASSAPVRLRIEPLLAFRDYHALTRRNPDAWTGFEEQRRLGSQGGPLPALPRPPLAPARAPRRPLRRCSGVARERGVPRGAGPRARLPRGPPAPGRASSWSSPRGTLELLAATVESGVTLDLEVLATRFRRPEVPRVVAGPRPLRRRRRCRLEGRARLERAAEAYLVRRADRSATSSPATPGSPTGDGTR